MRPKTKSESEVYTYRNGKKVYLKKEPDQFVVRALPSELAKMGIEKDMEQVSPSSTRVTVKKDKLDSVMKNLRKSITTHHAYKREDSGSEFLITDRILVTFKNPPSNEQLDKFTSKYSLIILERYSDKDFLFQLTDHTGMNPIKLVVTINESEADIIESCEHDLNKRMNLNITLPADAKYINQWHLHKQLNNASFDPRSSSNCEGAWQLLNNFGSNDVVIGVTDDGCKLDHSDFDSPNKFAHWGYISGSNLITRDSISANPQNMYEQGSDHGTCCCGVTAAETDGVLTVGAAPGCRLLPIKWQTTPDGGLSISDSKMLTVLNFLSDKVDVISNSWGLSPEYNFAINVINKISSLAQNGGRRGKGIVFLWAAGNDNCPIQFSGNVDIPFDNGIEIRPDGSAVWVGVRTSKIFEHNAVGIPGVMYIAALASNAQRSHYSNYGTGISVCAPSSNGHEYWRLSVTGLGITTASGESSLFTHEFGGTSSATPLVAGIAGLVISANPQLTAMQVISILQKTASKDLNMTGYSKTLPANYDLDTSWDVSPVIPFDSGVFKNINNPDGTWSAWFGFGKVDAQAAVAEALRLSGGINLNQNIKKNSTPGIAIPDNNPIGITDIINVTESGSLASIKIDLDITHTYIGDLIAKIISPAGTAIVLHNRNGGSAKNLVKSYDKTNTPALASLQGQSITGNWELQIIDMANIDSGTLNNWKIEIGVSQAQSEILNETPGIVIPDNDPLGIERSFNAAIAGIITEVEVGVDITHSYIGDLIVNLISPSGSIVSLHNRKGESEDNLIKTYTFSNNMNLQSLIGENAIGIWKLQIADLEGRDTGKLNMWTLKLIRG